MQLNENYENLSESYLFATVAKKASEYASAHPEQKVIKLSIGDVTLPLAPAVIAAMHKAVDEMGVKETFRGYPPYEGYDFLRESISEYYARRGVKVPASDIFVSDGAKSDCGNLPELFGPDNTVLVPDPVYPVYVDTNLMAGRKIVYAAATKENGFLPMPDEKVQADLIYICSPNNPTGAAYTKEQLQKWVDYALAKDAVILYDAAYECFVQDGAARSIYEAAGAEKCAIEMCSFSKTAGFTGTRCGYTVVPSALVRKGVSLKEMWFRRQSTKFNGVSYIVQRGAAAVFTEEGLAQIGENLAYYRENARIIADCMDRCGIFYTGGKNSPYIWLKCPDGMKSWEFFDYLLREAQVVGTPGSGFGRNGEGYFRLTAFGGRENTLEACERLYRLLKSNCPARLGRRGARRYGVRKRRAGCSVLFRNGERAQKGQTGKRKKKVYGKGRDSSSNPGPSRLMCLFFGEQVFVARGFFATGFVDFPVGGRFCTFSGCPSDFSVGYCRFFAFVLSAFLYASAGGLSLILRRSGGAQGQRPDHLSDIGNGHQFDFVFEFFARFQVLGGKHHPTESRFHALVYPFFRKGDGPHFAGQAHFAEQGGVFVHGDVACRAGQRGAHRQIDGRLRKSDAAHCVDVDVRSVERDAATLFQHRDQHHQFVVIDAQRHAAGESIGRLGQ